MALKLYYMAISPPSRSVLMGIRNLGLNVEIKNVNLLKGEHLSEEFLSLNPAHQVPVLVDNDFVLSESRAILAYLVNKYKPNSPLYPTDPRTQALIDQRLHYDHTVFERNAAAIRPVFQQNANNITQDLKNKITEIMEILDGFVSKTLWFVNDNCTLADIAILSNVSQIKACGYDISKHANLHRWYQQCKQLPGFDENEAGANEVGLYFKKILGNQF